MPTVDSTLTRARQRPGREYHGVSIDRAALSLRDQELNIAALDAGFERVYSQISQYFEENDQALLNFRRARGGRSRPVRLISDAGFNEIMQAASDGPLMFWVSPKNGAINPRRRGRPANQWCFHSFGYTWSRARLRGTPSADEVAAGPTGYNPIRFLNGVREMTKPVDSGGRNVAVHHLISRRGDICNSAPWDSESYHAAGYAIRQSISIELEVHIRRDRELGRQFNQTTSIIPFTEEQYLACAFLMKKHQAWVPDERILRFLGVDSEGRRLVRAGEPGCFTHHTVATRGKVDSYVEFEFPPGFEKGDSFPDHPTFNTTPELWNRRIQLFHGSKPNGTPISAWDNIFEKIRRMRSFNLQTEVFRSSGAGVIEINTPGINGTGPAAIASAAARNRAAGVTRSQQMVGTTRAQQYGQGRDASQASAQAWQTGLRNTARVVNQTPRVASTVNALSFNYSTGLWERVNTTNVPVASARSGNSTGESA